MYATAQAALVEAGDLENTQRVMDTTAIQSFADVRAHEDVGAIIRRHSTNETDIRALAVGPLDLAKVRRILDLGCGFGFMSSYVAPRVPPDAEFTGVDVCAENRTHYLAGVAAAGRAAYFHALDIDQPLPWASETFDLIVCSYSLYFFPDALSEIARLLAPQGDFVALVHSATSFESLLLASQLAPQGTSLRCLIERVCAENGSEVLGRWFAHVMQGGYPNSLRFEREDREDLRTYVHFKLPLLAADGPAPEEIVRAVEAHLMSVGQLVVEKDDACFWCREPRGRNA